MPIKDPIARKKYHKDYFKKYERKVTPNWKEQLKSNYKKVRLSMFEILGGYRCNRCGFSDMRALQIDHVDGCGMKNRKKGSHFLREIQENPSKFQVLCANCNWIKRAENGEVRKS